jgi:hypothetical protein
MGTVKNGVKNGDGRIFILSDKCVCPLFLFLSTHSKSVLGFAESLELR